MVLYERTDVRSDTASISLKKNRLYAFVQLIFINFARSHRYWTRNFCLWIDCEI